MNDIKIRLINAINEINIKKTHSDNFNLSAFLADLDVEEELNQNQLRVVERILKKVDVVKALFLEYELDFSAKTTDVVLPEDVLKLLLLKLLYLCQQNKDVKILNSILKIRDNNKFKVDNLVLYFLEEIKQEVLYQQ